MLTPGVLNLNVGVEVGKCGLNSGLPIPAEPRPEEDANDASYKKDKKKEESVHVCYLKNGRSAFKYNLSLRPFWMELTG